MGIRSWPAPDSVHVPSRPLALGAIQRNRCETRGGWLRETDQRTRSIALPAGELLRAVQGPKGQSTPEAGPQSERRSPLLRPGYGSSVIEVTRTVSWAPVGLPSTLTCFRLKFRRLPDGRYTASSNVSVQSLPCSSVRLALTREGRLDPGGGSPILTETIPESITRPGGAEDSCGEAIPGADDAEGPSSGLGLGTTGDVSSVVPAAPPAALSSGPPGPPGTLEPGFTAEVHASASIAARTGRESLRENMMRARFLIRRLTNGSTTADPRQHRRRGGPSDVWRGIAVAEATVGRMARARWGTCRAMLRSKLWSPKRSRSGSVIARIRRRSRRTAGSMP